MSLKKNAYVSEQAKKIEDLLKQLSSAGSQLDPNTLQSIATNPTLASQIAEEL